MIGLYFILDGREVVETDLWTWAEWIQHGTQRVAHDETGGVTVSTIFLGLNHNIFEGPPIVFETMVFGGPLDMDGERYSTWEEAETGHVMWLERSSRLWTNIDVTGNIDEVLEQLREKLKEVT